MTFKEQFEERTKIGLKKLPSLEIYDFSVSMGSCFSNHISAYLETYKFKHLSNPFGIIYNPISILHLLSRSLKLKYFEDVEFFKKNGQFYHYGLHSRMAGPDLRVVIDECNQMLLLLNSYLKQSKYLFLTFGTSHVFINKSSHEIVANCHKVSSTHFANKRLVPHEIITEYNLFIRELMTINPTINIMLTVSPIRHTRLGIHENNLSKSVLLLAVDELVNQNESCHYFPSYEIILDELRDYRYYKNDLIHPSSTAIEMIFNRFVQSVMTETTKQYLKDFTAYINITSHKVLTDDLEEIAKYNMKVRQIRDQIIHKYPHLEKMLPTTTSE